MFCGKYCQGFAAGKRQTQTYESFGDVDIHRLVKTTHDSREFTHTVRPIVEEEDGVVLCIVSRSASPSSWRTKRHGTFDSSFSTIGDDGLQELIGKVLLIVGLDGFNDGTLDFTIDSLTNTIDETVYSDLDSLPSLITVHGIVPSDDRRDLTVVLLLHEIDELLSVSSSRTGSSVTSVTEEVNVNVGDTDFFGSF